MTGDAPEGFGREPTIQQPSATLPSSYIGERAHRNFPWVTVVITLTAMAAIAALVVALVVALSRSTTTQAHATSGKPRFSAGETTAAQQQLCDTYKLVAEAAQVDTQGTDKALARISTTNGALMLFMAADNPALDAAHRDAAHALAKAYGSLTAKGSYGVVTEAGYQAALDEAITQDAVLKKLCGS